MFALYIFRQPFVHNLRVVTPDFLLFPFLFFADFYSLRFIVFSFKYISVLSGFFSVCHQDWGTIRLQLNCIIFGSRFKNISICFNHNQNSSKGKFFVFFFKREVNKQILLMYHQMFQSDEQFIQVLCMFWPLNIRNSFTCKVSNPLALLLVNF